MQCFHCHGITMLGKILIEKIDYRISTNSFHPSFQYKREELMWKLVYEIFMSLQIQKRVVSAEIIRGNTVYKVGSNFVF